MFDNCLIVTIKSCILFHRLLLPSPTAAEYLHLYSLIDTPNTVVYVNVPRHMQPQNSSPLLISEVETSRSEVKMLKLIFT